MYVDLPKYVYGCLCFFLLSGRFQRFYFMLMPSHPQWQAGFVPLLICWIETSPWFLVKGTRASKSWESISHLQFCAMKQTARSDHDRASGKRISIFLQLLLIPNGFFFPGQKFSGQFLVEVWNSWCLRSCTFAGSVSHLYSHLSVSLDWEIMMLSCSHS